MVTHRVPLDELTDYRRLAWALGMWAVAGDAGRAALGDPVYEEITLGLQETAKREGWFFSSCAFLPHWMLETLGLTLPQIGRTTKADQPLSRLAWNPLAEFVKPSDELVIGDVVQIGSNGDSHVLVVESFDGSTLHSFDYGQPGGKRRTRRVHTSGGLYVCEDGRPIRRVLKLERLVEAHRASPEYRQQFERGPMWLEVNPEVYSLWTQAPSVLVGSTPQSPKARSSPRTGDASTSVLPMLIVGSAATALALRRLAK
jgi:hypothetical protein